MLRRLGLGHSPCNSLLASQAAQCKAKGFGVAQTLQCQGLAESPQQCLGLSRAIPSNDGAKELGSVTCKTCTLMTAHYFSSTQ